MSPPKTILTMRAGNSGRCSRKYMRSILFFFSSRRRHTRLQGGVQTCALPIYVGEYELTPAFKIMVTREAARLFAQATGQPRFEIFAQSESEFFLKVVDARITFLKDGLILHQGGVDQKAKKMK